MKPKVKLKKKIIKINFGVCSFKIEMMDIIIGWFQSLRGAVRAISNEELPPMEDGPAGRTRSTLGIENNTLEHESNENNADYPEDLMCGICQDLYLNPLELIPCNHIFCQTCVTRLNQARILNCPVCRSQIEDTIPIHNMIRETYPRHIREREEQEQNSNAGYNMDQLAMPLDDNDSDFELFLEEIDSENDLETDDSSDDLDYEPSDSENEFQLHGLDTLPRSWPRRSRRINPDALPRRSSRIRN